MDALLDVAPAGCKVSALQLTVQGLEGVISTERVRCAPRRKSAFRGRDHQRAALGKFSSRSTPFRMLSSNAWAKLLTADVMVHMELRAAAGTFVRRHSRDCRATWSWQYTKFPRISWRGGYLSRCIWKSLRN